MKVIVTREDIDQGRRRDPNDCAVARALRRAGVSHSGVTGMLVFLDLDNERTSVFLPGPVQAWIVDFDWGAAVDPIEFELSLPASERSSARTGNSVGVLANRKTKAESRCRKRKGFSWSDSWRFWRRACSSRTKAGTGRRQNQPKVEEFQELAA